MDKALLTRVQTQSWYQRYPRGLPFALFLLISAVTGLSVYAIERADAQRRQTELDRTATEIGTALQRRAAANGAYLRAGGALFASPAATGLPVFRSFVNDLHLDQNYRGALGIGWAMKVDRASVANGGTMRPDGAIASFKIWPTPAPSQPYAVPVTYLQPDTASNRAAIGYDMYSEQVRREAMDEAARLERPIASGKVMLVQENDKGQRQAGFLIYMPVFDRTANGGKMLRGFVYSPFRARDFLKSASDLYQVGPVGIEIYDQAKKAGNLMASLPLGEPGGATLDKPFLVVRRQWVLTVTAPRSQSLSQMSRATLLFGSIVALLLLTIARLITRRAEEDRQVLDWQTRQAAIRNSLTRELNHRVKNTLANVLSIVALTKRRSTDLDDYVEKLTGRVRALSATHDLLTKSEWGNTLIREVVEAELAPYREAADNHLVMNGPDISLAPNDALSLGLAIHELTTNATKYGALSKSSGVVYIDWSMNQNGFADVKWRETGGPPVAEPTTRGFGRDLIEKIVAHELKTKVDLQFLEAGLECTLHVPVRAHGNFALRSGVPDKASGKWTA